MPVSLEICCADIESVLAAYEGGADRIELCSALELGGLTPSYGLIRKAVEIMGGEKVNVLIRPRPGDFIYSDAEFQTMLLDIDCALSLGARGIVSGELLPDGTIDTDKSHLIREQFPEAFHTFHRAFDLTPNPREALDTIIEIGYSRLLTSGCANSALKGALLIKNLVDQAAGNIEIMAGAGIAPDNIQEIIRLTGVCNIHASAKTTVTGKMKEKNGVSMGSAENDTDSHFTTSAETVRQLKIMITDEKS